jgi:hypothetical protein
MKNKTTTTKNPQDMEEVELDRSCFYMVKQENLETHKRTRLFFQMTVGKGCIGGTKRVGLGYIHFFS